MARRTFIHIGPPKTGSSYLQAIWRAHKDELEEHGLLYPGTQMNEQFRAYVVATQHPTYLPRMDEHSLGIWDRFTNDIEAWPGDALLSCESYARADDAAVANVIKRLHEVSDEVHVIITARDLARQFVASWQQVVKIGSTRTFDKFFAERSRPRDDLTPFWRGQDLPGLIRRWGADLPPGHVHLIVHGPRGTAHDRLWHQACQIIGTDPSVLTEVEIFNESLGVAEIETVRRMNLTLPKKRDRIATNTVTSKFLTTELRAVDREAVRPRITPEAHAWTRERSAAMVAELRTMDVDVVGELDDLLVGPTPPNEAEGRLPHDVSDAEVAEVSTALVGRLLMHEVRRKETIRSLLRQKADLETRLQAAEVSLPRRALRSARRRFRALRSDS